MLVLYHILQTPRILPKEIALNSWSRTNSYIVSEYKRLSSSYIFNGINIFSTIEDFSIIFFGG